MAAGKPPFIYENEEKSHGRKKRYSLYRNRSHPYAPGESKKGSRRFDGAGRIDEKTGVFTEFNGCSGRRTAWRVLCVDWEPPAWSIKVSRPGSIAKLNQDELKKKEQDENFQLTLKDLYELEKVKDIKTRDKILREATSSRDLVSRAQAAAAEAKRNENAKKLKEMLKKKGIKAAPKSAENEIWSGKWNTIKEYELDKDVPEQIKLPKTEEEKFFLVYYRSLRIITKIPKGKKELSPWEKEQKEKDQAKRKIKAILKESSARRKEFLENIISGKISPVKDESEVKEKIWEAMMALGSYIYASTVRDFYLKKSYYESSPEEKKAADESAGKLSSLHQMMIILHNSMKICNEPYDYNLVFNKNKGDALLKGYEVFEPYGWYFEDEKERQVLDGTSELYRKEKKE